MKIALCGSAPSSARLAPFRDKSFEQYTQGRVQQFPRPFFADESWEIWGCSPGFWGVAERTTRWFEVHRWEPGAPWLSPEYTSFLRAFRGIVYTGGPVPEITNHVVYPLERVEAEFSSYFLSSSLSLMFALAIFEIEDLRAKRRAGPEKLPPDELKRLDLEDTIGLWGVDMAANEEYQYQRPGCQFFILEAMRRNIGVYLPPESDLMRPLPVYGISEWYPSYIKATTKARQLNELAQGYQAQYEKAKSNLTGVQGEQASLDYFIKTWLSPYGMQTGIVMRITPGTGLGGGITHIDNRALEQIVGPVGPTIAPPETMAANTTEAELKAVG